MDKQLVFAFIKHYRCLSEVGINFDPRHYVEYDSKTKKLSFKENILPYDFFPDTIAGITAIVGKNGVGKSTILQWVFERIVSGCAVDELNGIIIIRDSGKTIIYHDVDIANSRDLEREGYELIDTRGKYGKSINQSAAIPLVLDSGNFEELTHNRASDTEWEGSRIISDNYLLVHDINSYSGVDARPSEGTVSQHLEAFRIQNNLRICLLLADPQFRNIDGTVGKPDINLPRYVIFSPNHAYSYILDNKMTSLKFRMDRYGEDEESKFQSDYLSNLLSVLPNRKMPGTVEKGKEKICEFIFTSLMSFYVNLSGIEVFPVSVKKSALEWLSGSPNLFGDDSYVHTEKSPMEWVSAMVERIEKALEDRVSLNSRPNEPDYEGSGLEFCREFFTGLSRSLDFLYYVADWKDGDPYIDVENVATINQKIGSLEKLMSNRTFLRERFFDLSYSHDLETISILSAGELAMLNLFSRLRSVWNERITVSNAMTPSMIILDEVENSFHPEWQRRFISRLISFCSSLATSDNPVQVIYTTHSPITLSDMPKCCVNMLNRVDGMTVSLRRNEMRQSFGANVFDLYNDSFFMEKGLIGEYAVSIIKRLAEEIEDFHRICIDHPEDFTEEDKALHLENLTERINLIGDERIRSYLLSRLGLSREQLEIERLKRRIEELENNERN